MTDDAVEEEPLRPNYEAEDNFLRELEERHKLGLLETIEDTYMAFSTLLGEPNILGSDDMYIPHSFTVRLAFSFFQRIDPFNLMIKHYEEIQEEMMSKQEERFAKEME